MTQHTPYTRPRYALSIRQPWADLILKHGKDIENRTWKPPQFIIGQRVAIHAGQRAAKRDYEDYGVKYDSERLGCILGEVTITGCVTDSDSRWFFGPVGFTLADPVAYEFPVSLRGRLGFFRLAPETRRLLVGERA